MKNVCLPEYNLFCEQKRLVSCYLPFIRAGLLNENFELIFDCSGKKFAVIQYYLTLLVLFLFYFQLKAEKHAVKSRKARSKIAYKNYLAI